LEGRDFTSHDRTNTSPVVIVDQTFARHFKLGPNPVGRLVNVGEGTQKAEIVGLVKDVKRSDLATAPRGEIYRPHLQNCWGYMNLTIRTRRSTQDITRAVRSELDQLDKDLPLENVRTLSSLVDSALQKPRLSVELIGGFAGMALLLTAIGLYGVLAYNLSQRSREIGIRMALGAQRSRALSLVVGHGLRLTLVGVGLGLVASLALTRVMGSLLYEVRPADPITYLCVSALLLAVGSLACWLPARRATRVDPIQSLRYE
jgi:putative ABC transport system permease protein